MMQYVKQQGGNDAMKMDTTAERELCDEFQVPECFRDSFLDGLLYGLQASWRNAIKKRGEGER